MPIFERPQRQLKPTQLLVISFFTIIAIGSVLLMLPISSKSGTWTDAVNCIFTASSATCVTGISLYDTFSHWSAFGQVVIILLIQVGGIGFLTMVTFFNFMLSKKRKVGLVHIQEAVGDMSNSTEIYAGKRLFTRIITYTMIFEVTGAIILMFTFVPKHGVYGVFMAFFMSISAFCNAGFDVIGIEGANVGLSGYTDSPAVLITLALLIIIGGLGFVVWDNISNMKTAKITTHTKTVLFTTAIMIVLGMVVYIIIQCTTPEVYGEYNTGEIVLTSFFGSVSARTAGFQAAPLPAGTEIGELFTMLLMFVGAAPGSTGGGIKVTTTAILVATVFSVIRNRNSETQLFGHRIKHEVVFKTLTIFALSLTFVGFAFMLIYFSNKNLNAIDTLFETVSAFTTTGFTSGVSEIVNPFSKLVLSFTMYVGRVGPVSLLLSLSAKRHDDRNSIMPETDIMVG